MLDTPDPAAGTGGTVAGTHTVATVAMEGTVASMAATRGTGMVEAQRMGRGVSQHIQYLTPIGLGRA
jgi:hypothetical protein